MKRCVAVVSLLAGACGTTAVPAVLDKITPELRLACEDKTDDAIGRRLTAFEELFTDGFLRTDAEDFAQTSCEQGCADAEPGSGCMDDEVCLAECLGACEACNAAVVDLIFGG